MKIKGHGYANVKLFLTPSLQSVYGHFDITCFTSTDNCSMSVKGALTDFKSRLEYGGHFLRGTFYKSVCLRDDLWYCKFRIFN